MARIHQCRLMREEAATPTRKEPAPTPTDQKPCLAQENPSSLPSVATEASSSAGGGVVFFAIERISGSQGAQCSNSPALFSTFFSPASMATENRFCFGGRGQLKL